MTKPYYEADGITIYHGDCREIMLTLGHFDPHPEIGYPFDALVTDPPYGVLLGEAGTGQERERNVQPYSMFSDTPQYLIEMVIPAIREALSKCRRAGLTPGNRNAFRYPEPDDFGVWYNPAGCGRGRWGFILAHIIFYYGVDPNAGQKATATSTSNKQFDDNLAGDHPCPKPLAFARWLVEKVSMPGELVLDPFMGSGTTLRAAKDCGRRAVGIEIEERYCEIAAKRMSQSVMFAADQGFMRYRGVGAPNQSQ